MRITDPWAIRALAHPLRLDLLELLSAIGPATAAHCGRVLDVPQANCSFHLRQLAKYGFVEEAEAGPDQRERRWRVPDRDTRIRVPAEASPLLSRQLARLVAERETQAILSHIDSAADSHRMANALVAMSAEEVADVMQKFLDLLKPYNGRTDLETGQHRYRWFVAATPTDREAEDDR